MPDRELRINLVFVKQRAERDAQAFHQGEHRRIRQTSELFAKEFKTRAALTKQFFKEEADAQNRAAKAANALFKERAAAAKRMLKEQADAQKRAIKEAADAEKRAARESAALLRTRMALTKQFFREQAAAADREAKAREKASKDFVAAQAKADRESIANFKESLGERERLRHEADRGREAALRKTVEADKQTRVKALKAANEAMKKLALDLDAFERKIDGDHAAFEESNRRVRQAKRHDFAERLKRYSRQVGQAERDESNKTKNAIERQQGAILSVAKAYTLLRIGAVVGQAIRNAFDSVARSAKESHDYIERIVRDMEALRSSAAEIMAMRGEEISGAGAARIAQRAAANAVAVESQQAFENTQEALSNEVLFSKADRVQRGRISREDVEALGTPTMAAAMGGGPAMQEAAARVQDALIRTAKRDFAGRIDAGQLREDLPAILESTQVGRGGNATSAKQVSEAITEFAGPGKMIGDPRRAAALMRVFLLGNEEKGGTLFRATMKGALQVRNNEEQMDMLREKGLTGNEEGDEFFFKSLDAIKKIAQDQGRKYHEVLYEFYGELREFESGELARVNRDIYNRALKGMSGARQRMAKKVADYRNGQGGRFQAAASRKRANQLNAASRFGELSILEEEGAGLVAAGGKLEVGEGLIDSLTTAARQQHLGITREQYENYQATGNLIRAELQAQADRGSRKAFDALRRGGFELEFKHPHLDRPAQRDALDLARREARRDIDAREQAAEMDRRRRLEQEARDREALGVGFSATAPVPVPVRRPLRAVMPPGIVAEEAAGHHRRAARHHGRRSRLPGADGRLPVTMRRGMSGHLRPIRGGPPPGPGDPSVLGRVGAGVGYSAGMFAADPAHESARLKIIGNHNFLGRYQERREATEADMASRRAGMERRRDEIASALRSAMGIVAPQIPAALPSKPHVMGR